MVSYIDVDAEDAGQRLDNFLIRHCKGVPKARLYRAIRGGEVRVNKRRAKPLYRLKAGDRLRLPPLNVAERPACQPPQQWLRDRLLQSIVYEDKGMILLNKPSGMAVHGGQSEALGVIEGLRLVRPDCTRLELVHRLDKGTSGCLIVAKKRSYLRVMHDKLRQREVKKQYFVLVKGEWSGGVRRLTTPLLKRELASGERIVTVNEVHGKAAVSYFTPWKRFKGATLMLVKIKTGRTHQIRVHAASLGYPVAGDDKYGCDDFNIFLKKQGLSRMFLHSASIECLDHATGYGVNIGIPLPKALLSVLKQLKG